MAPLAVGSASGCVASGSCRTSPSIKYLQPSWHGRTRFWQIIARRQRSVAYIKPLLPSQTAAHRTGTLLRRERPVESNGRLFFGGYVAPLHKKIVAIVDGDPGIRKATADILLAFGYGTETFDSAEAFLNAAATSQASCLLTDIQLGDISGVELVHQLSADGYKYPTIFMTALDDEWIRSKAAAAGGVAVLIKPLRADLLAKAIVKAIASL
jgi:CheY-like chemotaxis protein